MTRRLRAVSTVLFVAAVGVAATASAQTIPPRTQPIVRRPLPKPKPKLSNKLFVRADGFVGLEHFNASQTFKGVFDSANGVVYGGGIDVVKGHLFVRGDVSHFGKTGERVFDSNGQVFRLGIPQKVSITPVIGAVGVRGIRRRTGLPTPAPVRAAGRIHRPTTTRPTQRRCGKRGISALAVSSGISGRSSASVSKRNTRACPTRSAAASPPISERRTLAAPRLPFA